MLRRAARESASIDVRSVFAYAMTAMNLRVVGSICDGRVSIVAVGTTAIAHDIGSSAIAVCCFVSISMRTVHNTCWRRVYRLQTMKSFNESSSRAFYSSLLCSREPLGVAELDSQARNFSSEGFILCREAINLFLQGLLSVSSPSTD